MRLDLYLATEHPEYSRSVWQKYIKAGYVSVGGRVATGFNSPAEGAKIDINIPKSVKKPLDLPVLYEDDNVVVIDKPAGVLTHSKGALNDEFTVADFIVGRSKQPDVANNRFGIVHRLDRATSGVLIGAKNQATLKLLQKQFQNRKTKKTYLAVADLTDAGRKTLANNGDDFVIDLPIARNPKKPSQFRVDSNGKAAVTEVKVLKTNSAQALLELRPQTGRTHQLRVHLAYVGLPIVGDVVYGEPPTAGRMMLHAKELEVTIPDGQRKIFKAKVPNEFRLSE
jgi:23S rRNA pseudouridine1911/1915/1917 synthase